MQTLLLPLSIKISRLIRIISQEKTPIRGKGVIFAEDLYRYLTLGKPYVSSSIEVDGACINRLIRGQL